MNQAIELRLSILPPEADSFTVGYSTQLLPQRRLMTTASTAKNLRKKIKA